MDLTVVLIYYLNIALFKVDRKMDTVYKNAKTNAKSRGIYSMRMALSYQAQISMLF